jgi:hypothetical protein
MPSLAAARRLLPLPRSTPPAPTRPTSSSAFPLILICSKLDGPISLPLTHSQEVYGAGRGGTEEVGSKALSQPFVDARVGIRWHLLFLYIYAFLNGSGNSWFVISTDHLVDDDALSIRTSTSWRCLSRFCLSTFRQLLLVHASVIKIPDQAGNITPFQTAHKASWARFPSAESSAAIWALLKKICCRLILVLMAFQH